MKNKPMMMNQPSQTRSMDWLYGEQEDDFLSGKTPHEIQAIWEDEE